MLYPTNAFDLLTDNSHRMAKVQCAVFKGNVRDIFIDRKEFSGSIQKQVEDAYDFVLRHINLGASIEGVYRSDSYELPTAAIREMIANAVVHRSYMAKSCVQVCIFDDRLEVSSPGMLYGGLDIAGAKAGRSVCRNGVIAEAFRYMNIIEAWGTGIPRIIQRCKEYGLQEPVFEEIAGSFRVTIYRKVTTAAQKVTSNPEKVTTAVMKVTSTPRKVIIANEKVTSKQQKLTTTFETYALLLKNAKVGEKYIAHIREVYQECKQGQAFKRSDIQKWLQCSPSQATKILNAMKLACIVHKIQGQGNGMYVFDDTSR